MSLHHRYPLFDHFAAAASGLRHQLGQRCLRPILQALQPQAVLQIENLPPDQKLLALTIDDSPSPETWKILDSLSDHGATATFFIHGARIRDTTSRQLMHRILEDGHEVGNHMPDSVPSLSLAPSEFATEFERNHRILLGVGALPVRFRPSHGFYNRTMAEFLRTKGMELGYRPEFYLGLNFPWDVFFKIPQSYARHNAASAVPGRIVVFHDNQDRLDLWKSVINQTQRTLTSLPTFFAELKKQGFNARSLAQVEAAAVNSQKTTAHD